MRVERLEAIGRSGVWKVEVVRGSGGVGCSRQESLEGSAEFGALPKRKMSDADWGGGCALVSASARWCR